MMCLLRGTMIKNNASPKKSKQKGVSIHYLTSHKNAKLVYDRKWKEKDQVNVCLVKMRILDSCFLAILYVHFKNFYDEFKSI